MKPAYVPPTVRVLSALLTLGSVIGVLVPVLLYVTDARLREAIATQAPQSPWVWIDSIVAFLMFAWSFWIGFELWVPEPRTLRRARITFLAQIPNIAFPRFVYEFQTLGVTVRCLSTDRSWSLNIHAGSNLTPGIVPWNHDIVLGVNVVAIAAVIYLSRIISENTRRPVATSGFGLV